MGAQLSFIRASPVSKPRLNHPRSVLTFPPPSFTLTPPACPLSLSLPPFPFPWRGFRIVPWSLSRWRYIQYPVGFGRVVFQNGQRGFRKESRRVDCNRIDGDDDRRCLRHCCIGISTTRELIGVLMNTLMRAPVVFASRV